MQSEWIIVPSVYKYYINLKEALFVSLRPKSWSQDQTFTAAMSIFKNVEKLKGASRLFFGENDVDLGRE